MNYVEHVQAKLAELEVEGVEVAQLDRNKYFAITFKKPGGWVPFEEECAIHKDATDANAAKTLDSFCKRVDKMLNPNKGRAAAPTP